MGNDVLSEVKCHPVMRRALLTWPDCRDKFAREIGLSNDPSPGRGVIKNEHWTHVVIRKRTGPRFCTSIHAEGKSFSHASKSDLGWSGC